MSRVRRALPGVAIAAAACLLMSGCGGVEVPKSFKEFNAKDGTVKLKRPAGWEQKRGTAKEFRSVAFESGPAKIRVLADLTGSLVAGPGASMETEDVPEELTAVAAVHEEFTLKQLSDELGELDVKSTDMLQTGFGNTRRSEFTVSGTLGSATHGYVVTALGHDKRVRVICTCPEKKWKTLKPAFDEVIESMGAGQRE
ncbi:MAG TPA: hypothetical protein VMY37_30500 [Thermoguttaceae bacterium]|nr:hypothetical protein [Thermoguttaceae bacterium]